MPPVIFLSAGESSGDLHGSAVAAELRRRFPAARLLGLGGERMRQAGVELLAELDRLAVMGFAEVLSSLPYFLRLRRRVRRVLAEENVDLLIPIDYPGFNLPLAETARARGTPVLYYIAPQVWAWREKRARRLARACDMVCSVLPFEPAALTPHGADVRFVGHPLLDVEPGPAAPSTDGAVLALFPGSREQEVARMLPVFAEAARRVQQRLPGVRVVVGRAQNLPESLYVAAAAWPLVDSTVAAETATAAITKSGTITLQLALASVPMVVGYRTSRLTFAIARRLVTVEHIALANLVAERRVVPELIQDALTVDALVERIVPLLDPENEDRRSMVDGLIEVSRRLGSPGCAGRVVDEAVELLGGTSAVDA